MEEGESRSGGAGAASEAAVPWRPWEGTFCRWNPSMSVAQRRVLEGEASPKLLARLTKDIVKTFQICNPAFQYSEASNPKRFLTSPSIGVLNNGHDNANSDLILHVNLVLINTESKQRYVVKDMLGQGTFGQVAKCWVSETKSFTAVKIIKNQAAYYRQALVEVAIVKKLNQTDPGDKHHIVRILDHFVYQKHLCISFEMLGSNLYELISSNNYKGLSLSIVQMFSRQILDALVVIKDAGIIHCDLKPENILVSKNVKPAEIKIIDFGSACPENQTVYSYIQSRYYRSPEVLLGYPYTTAIDMWSFGCIVAELFLGLPLFPGASEYDLVKRMIEILSTQPPDDLLRDSKNTSKFFMHVGSYHKSEEGEACEGVTSAFRVLTEEECEAKDSKRPSIGKRYFKYVKLEDIIVYYPYRKNLREVEINKEKETRLALIDLLRGLLEFDPGKRWSPSQASRHPFLTGERFICPYKPQPETPRIPVSRTVAVDYNQGGGHWLGAGLSPQVSSVNNCLPHNSPRFQMAPLIHGSSYGSLGSHGSYNDNAALGSSYGSYGDVNNAYAYYSPVVPSGLNTHAQFVWSFHGASPDARLRPQLCHGNGFGVSPTGSFGPSLGHSPSQPTPPSSQMQYGPTSPARGHVHGSPLGKAAAIGQYNKKRYSVYPGNLCVPPHENTSQQWQGHHSDGLSCSYQDTYSRGHIGSPRSTLPNFSNRRQQMGGGNGLSSGHAPGSYQSLPGAGAHNPNMAASHASEASSDKPESSSSLPNPGDWDPCYSDELLLQEENSEVRPLMFGAFNGGLSSSSDPAFVTSAIGRLSLGNSQINAGPNFISSNYRTEGQVQAYSFADGSPPTAHDNVRASYNRYPPCPQSSTSRFGQQPVQRGNHMHSTSTRNDQNHHRNLTARSSYGVADTHSSTHPIFANGMSWGPRVGHPISTTVPSSHERKDYGRI